MDEDPGRPCEGLHDLVKAALEGAEPLVPVAEHSARCLRQLQENDDAEAGALLDLIAGECAFAAELMRAAHSPLFGGLPALRGLDVALERVGPTETLALLDRTSERAHVQLSSPWARPRMGALVEHARGCGAAAAWLACRAGLGHLADAARLTGLLHDLGKLVILRAIDEKHGALAEKSLQDLLAADHARAGALLLARWGLAPEIVEAVARHHESVAPGDASILLVILRLADDAARLPSGGRSGALASSEQERLLDALGVPLRALEEIGENLQPAALPA